MSIHTWFQVKINPGRGSNPFILHNLPSLFAIVCLWKAEFKVFSSDFRAEVNSFHCHYPHVYPFLEFLVQHHSVAPKVRDPFLAGLSLPANEIISFNSFVVKQQRCMLWMKVFHLSLTNMDYLINYVCSTDALTCLLVELIH